MDYRAIISTLCYFNIFDYPLTKFEIWKFLFQKNSGGDNNVSLFQIEQMLKKLKEKNIAKEKNGFYYLNADEKHPDIIRTRIKRNRIAEQKYKKALRIIKILRCIPTIKMIAVCNTLSYNNAKESSDIDLFIITKEKNIWLSRLLAVSILKILNLRPKPNNSSDKICASFFVSENNSDLEKIQITPPFHKGEDGGFYIKNNPLPFDIYLIYWIATLVPIYNKEKTYEKFMDKNLWIKKYLPNADLYLTSPEKNLTSKKSLLYFIFYFSIFIIPEKLAKKIQLIVMPKNLRQMSNKDTKVILNNSMLKFHDKDRREEYYNKWAEIIRKNNRMKL
ncbi:MAG: hypothetical protein V1655_01515 [bacterium]